MAEAWSVPKVLPTTPTGRRSSWTFDQLDRIAQGADAPSQQDIESQYSQSFLDSVSVRELRTFYSSRASHFAAAVSAKVEVNRPEHLSVLLDLNGGSSIRYTCIVDPEPPHKIVGQQFSDPLPLSGFTDSRVESTSGSIQIRDYGGDGNPAILLHGGGNDVSIWDWFAPLLDPFHVVALDLPAHGRADPGAAFSFGLANDYVDTVVRHFAFTDVAVVGHSMGGRVALEYAARHDPLCLIALDGPNILRWPPTLANTLRTSARIKQELLNQDVENLLTKVTCPSLFVITVKAPKEREAVLTAAKNEFVTHLRENHPSFRVEWLDTDHMLQLSKPEETAELITDFVRSVASGLEETRNEKPAE